MPNKGAGVGKNTDPSPMTYEVQFFPSQQQTRTRLAMEAESMSMADLKAAAADAQIDIAGATTKDKLVEAVRTGARGTDATTQTPKGE